VTSHIKRRTTIVRIRRKMDTSKQTTIYILSHFRSQKKEEKNCLFFLYVGRYASVGCFWRSKNKADNASRCRNTARVRSGGSPVGYIYSTFSNDGVPGGGGGLPDAHTIENHLGRTAANNRNGLVIMRPGSATFGWLGVTHNPFHFTVHHSSCLLARPQRGVSRPNGVVCLRSRG